MTKMLGLAVLASVALVAPSARAATVVSCDGEHIVAGPWTPAYYPPGSLYVEIIGNDCTLDTGSRCSYEYTESWYLQPDGSYKQVNSSVYNNTCPF